LVDIDWPLQSCQETLQEAERSEARVQAIKFSISREAIAGATRWT